MTQVIKLRALSDENDNFLRDYDIAADSTLFELHDMICRDLGFDRAEMASFYASDKLWNPGEEFVSMDMGDGKSRSMAQVTVEELLSNDFDRTIYLFDIIGERALYMERIVKREADQTESLPRVSLSEGEAPDQYEPSQGGSSRSIFDEAFEEFGSFEGDESYDDE